VLYLRCCLLIAIFMLSTLSVFAQGVRKPEIFVGYSNLQGEGVADRTDPSDFFSPSFSSGRGTLHGGNAEVTFFPFEMFGLTADASFNRKHRSIEASEGSDSENTNIVYLMAGPSRAFSLAGRLERLQPFARVLLGLAHTGYQASSKRNVANGNLTTAFNLGSTDFAMAFGGGVDVKINEKIKVRVIQFDYAPIFSGERSVGVLGDSGVLEPAPLDSKRQDNFRFSFGVTF
jgi:opacity protein-like surface antigen